MQSCALMNGMTHLNTATYSTMRKPLTKYARDATFHCTVEATMQDWLNDVFLMTVVLAGGVQYPSPAEAHHVVAARKGIISSGSTTDIICSMWK